MVYSRHEAGAEGDAVASDGDMKKAVRVLSRADPVLSQVIKRVGVVSLRAPGEPFPSLVRSIFYQQLAGPAAAAILRRFLALYGPDGAFPTSRQVLDTPEDKLRAVGLSRQKLGYLKDLAAKFSDGTLTNEKLTTLPDEELERALMSVKGIGRWTADMFLMNVLHRLDILAVDDLGLRKGAQQAFGLETTPTPKALLAMGERWRPYRSVAALYLWRGLDIRPPEQPPRNARRHVAPARGGGASRHPNATSGNAAAGSRSKRAAVATPSRRGRKAT